MGTVSRYQKRISGPLLDRIDIFVEVPRVEYEKLAAMVRVRLAPRWLGLRTPLHRPVVEAAARQIVLLHHFEAVTLVERNVLRFVRLQVAR